MPTVAWETVNVESGKTVKQADGTSKKVVLRTIPYTYPTIGLLSVQTPEDFAVIAQAIVAEAKAGFTALRTLAECWNYGLQHLNKAAVLKGQDVRHSTAQRNAIKLVSEMLRADLIEPADALKSLARQSISDAQEIVDAVLAEATEPSVAEEPTVA